jgi:hypothetical protein
MSNDPAAPSSASSPPHGAGSGAAPRGVEPPAPLAALSPMLKALQPQLVAIARQWAEAATDAQLAHVAATIASENPRAARRIAYHLLGASAVRLEGYAAERIECWALPPASMAEARERLDEGWELLAPNP